MSDLKLRTVAIRNWATIHKAELEMPEKGLVLVVGKNLAANGKLESVGSGKTALGEAICRTLLGVKGRFNNLGFYSSDDANNKNMYVRVEAELKGKLLRVETGHKCKELSATGEGLRYTYGEGSSPVERGKPSETRSELTSILGVTPELASWTVFIDGDKLQFNDQSERGAVSLLMAALRQPSWDVYQKRALAVMNDAKANYEKVKSVYASTQQEIEECNSSLAEVEQEIKVELSRLADEENRLKKEAKSVQDSIILSEESLQKLKDRQREIKKSLKDLEEKHAKEYADLEKQKASYNTAASTVQLKRTKLVEHRADIKSKWQTEQKYLSEIRSEPEICPKCGKKWDKKHNADELKSQEERVKNLQESIDKKTKDIENVDNTLSENAKLIREIEAQIRAMRAPAMNSVLSREYEQNDDSIQRFQSDITRLKLKLQHVQIGPDKSEITRLKAVKSERQKTLAEAKDSLNEAAQGLVESEAVVKVAVYWYEAFGPSGIPNMILTEAIPPLNEVAKRISLLMTGGTIAVNYDTSRELASGESSAELVIKIKNKLGSRRVEGSSKGESRLVNLIIAETLSEVGSVSNRIGFRWYDEILNSQDPTVRRSILAYLRDLANRLGILVFVVDHHQEASNYADYVLIAEKIDKGTELHWG